MEKDIEQVTMTEVPDSSIGQIDFNAVPGTSHLVDIDKDAAHNVETGKGIILIPEPSDDPNDPLNWSKKRKSMQMFCIVVFCYAGGVPGTCIYSILTQISEAPGVSITIEELNNGTGYLFLFCGLGGLIMLPLAQQYGKRPIYLISILFNTLFNALSPSCKTAGVWYAYRILSGFFISTIESLPEITVTDMYFEHERATYMGIYGAALFSSNYFAPALAGFVTDGMGWKWTMYMACIWAGVALLFLFFFMEETNYDRRIRVKKDPDGSLVAITSRGEAKNVIITETITKKKLGGKTSTDVVEVGNRIANQTSVIIEETDGSIEYPQVKTFWQKLSLTSGIRKENHLKDFLIMPFTMVQFPVVLYSGFLYGVSLFFYSVLNTTESTVLSGAPYNFSASMCGLAYLSPVIWVVIVYPYAGWSTDWVKIWFAKKHKGISQAEDRLWVLLLYAILGPAAIILWGVGAAHGINWFGCVMGLGMIGGLCIIGCVSSVTYALDCYSEMNVAAMIVVIIIRNTMNFALDYGITPFLDACGMQNTFIACAFICFGCIMTFLIMVWTGLYWRKKGGKAYWKLVDYYRKKGVIE